MKLLRAFRFFLSAVCVVVAVGCLVAVVGIITVPRALGWHGVIVLSGSMEPTLKVGGIAFYERVSPEDVSPGDIITFRPFARQTLVTHRVVGRIETANGDAFITKGDANNNEDIDPVPANRIVGRVALSLPYVGRAVDKLHTGNNYYVIVGIPVALLILNELYSVATEIRRHRSKTASSSSSVAAAEGAPR